jgi:hypothetical protein
MVRCAACGHSWIESRAVEVIDVPDRSLPTTIDVTPDADREIKRLVEASRAAQEAFDAMRRERQRWRRGWIAFAAAIAAPFVLVALFPEQVVRTAPAAARFYERAGIAVNVYGLDIRRIEQKHMILDGTRVLAIKGEIVNVSNSDRKVPSLRFILRDQNAKEVYAWTVDSAVRPLRPGEMTNFTTRVASPPAGTEAVQIRFARVDEIGSNAPP